MGQAGPSPREFLEAIWAGCPEGYAELHLIRPSRRQQGADENEPWFYGWPRGFEDLLRKSEDEPGQWNVYFGVGIRSRMAGKDQDVLAIQALHCDVDFKRTPRDEAIKKIREFPLKPSAGVLTGGGLHVYWFLREAVAGQDLEEIRTTNRAIAHALGGDRAACTLKQILRLPGSINIKYPERPIVTVPVWRPEVRYNVSDFGFLPAEPAKAKPSEPQGIRAAPGVDLSPEQHQGIAKLLGELWTKGWRHRMALDVAGMLAHADVSEASATEIVRMVSGDTGDPEDRVRQVADTYANFQQGKEIAGASTIEKMIVEEWPQAARPQARKTLNELRKLLPRSSQRPERKSVEPDFEIKQIVKFDSRPARYQVTIRYEGSDHEVACETDAFMNFRSFREAFFEATANKMLAAISQARWEAMLPKAPLQIKPAPIEGTVPGMLRSELDDFLDSRKENPEVGLLRAFPGYDEHGTFFTFAALKAHLKAKGIKATDREIAHFLKNDQWQDERRRIQGRQPRLWIKNLNGHDVQPEPSKTDLFSQPGIGAPKPLT